MAAHRQELELFPGCGVALALFRHVRNAAALRGAALQGSVAAALLSPALVSPARPPHCRAPGPGPAPSPRRAGRPPSLPPAHSRDRPAPGQQDGAALPGIDVGRAGCVGHLVFAPARGPAWPEQAVNPLTLIHAVASSVLNESRF